MALRALASRTEGLQRIIRRYTAGGGSWPAEPKEIAAWAIKNRLWFPHQSQLVAQCAEQLAQAMREEYLTDPQGRRVRAKHAVRLDGEQGALWDDIRTADRPFMKRAFQQRRQQIVGDCRQLKTDVDSFNDNREDAEPIQISFDFRHDLVEGSVVG